MTSTLNVVAACVFAAASLVSQVARAEEPSKKPSVNASAQAPVNELSGRVTAVEKLVNEHAEGARYSIEQALDDAHPQVRVAAADALHKLGDPLAVGALERARKRESTAFVRAKMEETLGVLKKSSTLASVRVGVQIGSMSVSEGIDPKLAQALSDAAYRRASMVHGAVIVRSNDQALRARLKQRKIGQLKLDGRVRRLTRTVAADGTARVSAEVEFMVLRGGETLKATVTGSAHVEEPAVAASRSAERALERDRELVDAAVESALAHASTYFADCAK